MAKYWCTKDGEKVFLGSDYDDVPGLVLKDFSENEQPKQPQQPAAEPAGMDIVEASKAYEAKFGAKPHHAMKLETILAKLAE
jgi:hypothetical protein